MLITELLFPHAYELSEAPELPGLGRYDLPVHYFPPPASRTEQDGAWIRVSPHSGEDWIGVFAAGYGDPGLDKVLSTPDRHRVCVISGGGAYVLNVCSPTQWETLPFLPITYACSMPDLGFLLFGTFSKLIAWHNGVVWQCQVAVDGLSVEAVSPDRIEGCGYDPAVGGYVPFLVDAKTGVPLRS